MICKLKIHWSIKHYKNNHLKPFVRFIYYTMANTKEFRVRQWSWRTMNDYLILHVVFCLFDVLFTYVQNYSHSRKYHQARSKHWMEEPPQSGSHSLELVPAMPTYIEFYCCYPGVLRSLNRTCSDTKEEHYTASRSRDLGHHLSMFSQFLELKDCFPPSPLNVV